MLSSYAKVCVRFVSYCRTTLIGLTNDKLSKRMSAKAGMAPPRTKGLVH